METSALSPLCSLIPFSGVAFLALASYLSARSKGRHTRRPFGWGTWWWVALFDLCFAIMGVYVAHGLFHGDIIDLSAFSLTALVCGIITLQRERWFALLERGRARHPMAIGFVSILLIALSAYLSLYAIELSWNDHFPNIDSKFIALEWVMVFLAMMSLYFLFQRRSAGAVLAVLFCTFVGLAAYFVWLFRGAAILPSDVLALGTAAEVAGRFEYTLTGSPTHALTFGIAALAPLALVPPGAIKGIADVLKNLAGAAVFACLLGALLVVPNYRATFDTWITNGYWTPFVFEDYKWNGFLPSFMTAVQDLPIEVPENYSPASADAKLAELAKAWKDSDGSSERRRLAEEQFQQTKPSIIVVQNESFADLSEFNGLESGYEGPQFFKTGLPDAVSRGLLAIPNLGGGTCNAEFELLTGNSLNYIGVGKYPFSMYNLSGLAALPNQMKEMGYRTVGIHPEDPANWHRDTVYEEFGFEEFLSIDDFEGAERIHNAVSDRATYQTILEMLESEDDPLFVLDVTMQNHSGYDQGQIPEDELGNFHPDYVSSEEDSWINEYVGGIQESDRALSEFVAELKDIGRPVVLVFYGDHQPFFTEAINNHVFPDEENELAHLERTYHTDYVIWANYDIAGQDQQARTDPASSCYLAAMVLDAVGAPLTDFQQMQLELRKSMPAINVYGCLGTDGTWYEPGEGPMQQAYRDYQLVQYRTCVEKL